MKKNNGYAKDKEACLTAYCLVVPASDDDQGLVNCLYVRWHTRKNMPRPTSVRARLDDGGVRSSPILLLLISRGLL
jgi:hypothetical protein